MTKPYFGTILDSFCANLGKNEFFWEKKNLSVFKYSNYVPSTQKSENTNEPFLRKCRTDGQTDRQTDRQTA